MKAAALVFAAMAAPCVMAAADAMEPAPAVQSANPTPTDAMGFVAMAGASDLYEIQSSQIALQKSQSDSVKRFAQMMIDQHTMTTQQVTTAAQSAGLTPPPPTLLPPQQKMIAQLQSASSGAAFDRLYLSQQRTAHQLALKLHSNYAKNGDTPALKQAASGAVPVVQSHIDELKTLKA